MRAAASSPRSLAGEPLPALAPERLERALAGLARDGLIVRDDAGAPALPGSGRHRRRSPRPGRGQARRITTSPIEVRARTSTV